MVVDRLWNINIHYDGLLAASVGRDAAEILDVGTGDGFLAARLAARGVPGVTALDVDAPVLARARARFPDAQVRWVHADVMTADLPVGAFDAVVSNAALHHFEDARGALRRLVSLLAPDGTLAVVTFVKPSRRDALWHATGWIAAAVTNRVRGKWDHSAPIKWPPPHTFDELRQQVRAELPAARVRRLLYNRVLITWHATA